MAILFSPNVVTDFPIIPENTSKEFIVHVKRAGAVYKRAFHFANKLETVVPGGVEIYTGWYILSQGRRAIALEEGECVQAWMEKSVHGSLNWTFPPITPKIERGTVRQFLLSVKKFGCTDPETIVAYYANGYVEHVSDGVQSHTGWRAGYPGNLIYFLTIGDQLLAWAEPPKFDSFSEE
jgi:hypothetical protein